MSIVEVESSAKDEAAKTHALACFMKPQLQLTRTTKMQTQRLSKVDGLVHGILCQHFRQLTVLKHQPISLFRITKTVTTH